MTLTITQSGTNSTLTINSTAVTSSQVTSIVNAALEDASLETSSRTRAELVIDVAGGETYPDGTRVPAGGLIYIASTGATAISDLPGLVPAHPYSLEHFPSNSEAYNWASENNTLLETSDVNQYRGNTINAGYNATQGDAWFSVASQIDEDATVTSRKHALHGSITLNDPTADGGHYGVIGQGFTNINAGAGRCSVIGAYGSVTLRGPEPDGTRMTTGEGWGGYMASTFTQTNGFQTPSGTWNRFTDGSAPTVAGRWTTDGSNAVLNINYIDGDSNDRTAELQDIRPGHVIRFERTSDTSQSDEWEIDAVGTDNTTYITFSSVTYNGAGSGGTTSSGQTCNIAGDDIYDASTASDGLLIGAEIKAGNWGGTDVTDITSSVRKVNISLVTGGDSDNAHHMPVTAGIKFGSSNTYSGWNYGVYAQSMKIACFQCSEPFATGVYAFSIKPEGSDGTWANSPIVLPPDGGIGVWNSTGTVVTDLWKADGGALNFLVNSTFDGAIFVDASQPIIRMNSSSSTAGIQQVAIQNLNDIFAIQTRNEGDNTTVATDMRIRRGASGATEHELLIQGTEVLSVVSAGANVAGHVKPATYTVGTAPSASTAGAGALIYVSDGNAGAATLACSDGTNWKVIALGATIST